MMTKFHPKQQVVVLGATGSAAQYEGRRGVVSGILPLKLNVGTEYFVVLDGMTESRPTAFSEHELVRVVE